MGRVVIHTQPEGARILVNGEETRYRSPVNFALSAGTHRITVERGGFESLTQDVVVRQDQTVQVQIELKRNAK